MRIKPSLSVFSFILLFAAAAGAAEVRGKVMSTGQNPVAGAVVLHRPSGIKTETGADGGFVLDLPDADRYELEVIHPDFYERAFLVGRRKPGQTLVLALVPLIKQSEEVVVTALRYPESSIDVPAASSIVSGETLAEKLAPEHQRGPPGRPGRGRARLGGLRPRPVHPGPGPASRALPRRRRPARKRPPDGPQRVFRQSRGHRTDRGVAERVVGLLRFRRDRGRHPPPDPHPPVRRRPARPCPDRVRHGQRGEAHRAGPRRIGRDLGVLCSRSNTPTRADTGSRAGRRSCSPSTPRGAFWPRRPTARTGGRST